MRCGADTAPGAAFCSRCGNRMPAPAPASRNEFALERLFPSLWHFAGGIVVSILPTLAAIAILSNRRDQWRLVPALVVLSCVLFATVLIMRRKKSWSLTSERLIEREGWLSVRRREVELTDIRAIEVTRSLGQRLLGLGDVLVSSAASADYQIILHDIPNPEGVADTVRKARLRRLT